MSIIYPHLHILWKKRKNCEHVFVQSRNLLFIGVSSSGFRISSIKVTIFQRVVQTMHIYIYTCTHPSLDVLPPVIFIHQVSSPPLPLPPPLRAIALGLRVGQQILDCATRARWETKDVSLEPAAWHSPTPPQVPCERRKYSAMPPCLQEKMPEVIGREALKTIPSNFPVVCIYLSNRSKVKNRKGPLHP